MSTVDSRCMLAPKSVTEVSSSTAIIESFAVSESPIVIWTADSGASVPVLGPKWRRLEPTEVPGESNTWWAKEARTGVFKSLLNPERGLYSLPLHEHGSVCRRPVNVTRSGRRLVSVVDVRCVPG